MPSLLVFLALVGAVAFTGSRFVPGEWYEQLDRAPWTPPNAAFAPVWTVLYVTVAVAGWLVWRRRRRLETPLAIWLAQLALNGLWSWLFFGRHALGLAFLDIVLLLAAIAAFVIAARPVSRAAAGLFLPYAAWVLYASTLNLYAWLRNPQSP